MADRARAIRQAVDFEREVGNLIELAGYRTQPVRPGALDYLYRDRDQRRIAVLVKYLTRRLGPESIADALRSARASRAEFLWVVTSTRPSPGQVERLAQGADTFQISAEWVTRDDFAAQLDLPPPQQRAAQQVGLAAALIRAAPTAREAELRASGLYSRLPRSAIEAIGDSTLSDFLRIGEEIRDVTFVISDIKNYSSIVAKARPRDLQDAMTDIYRQTREVIRAHGGTLVDFAGDGALAVFDYPISADGAATRAVLCATDVIEVSRVSLATLLRRMNADIETGTRIGIASGDVLIVDSGLEEPDPQFVSDAINLAARLQASAPPNGVLMDNRTHSQLEDTDPDLVAKLDPTRTRVPAIAAKGQLVDVASWTVDEAEARAIAAGHSH
jgi:class 3 adenylate cyclase